MNWPEAIFTSVLMVAFWGAAAFLIGQVFMTWRAKMSVTREEGYKALLEETRTSQRRVAEALDRVQGELADMNKRTAELERMMKEVA